MTKEIISQKTKNVKIKRIYSHYETWEDYKNGMYEEKNDDNKFYRITQSIILLSTPMLLYDSMLQVTKEWCISSDFNLSNTSSNRKAWLGQSACNLKIGATESEVRKAWNTISEYEKICANNVANAVINVWENNYRRGSNEEKIRI